jgi:hypothetical protein
LIEMMILKMQMTQFDLIVNLIQKTGAQLLCILQNLWLIAS